MPSAVASAPPGSSRVQLAEVALRAACGVPGVLSGEAGPGGLLVTEGPGGELLTGVRVVAEPGGRYSVELGLRSGLVPLHPLGEAVRGALTGAAGAAGLERQLGTVSVAVLDIDGATP